MAGVNSDAIPVRDNDWRRASPPDVVGLVPSLSLSVVLPAHNCQPELDLTLAALTQQTYPQELFDVIVVDDGSLPPLDLPRLRPRRTRLVRLESAAGHGSGRARDAGAREAEGDIVLFLDADIVTHRHHLSAHARWHHAMADAVVIGYKTFVDFSGITAEQVMEGSASDTLDGLLSGRPRQPHGWLERFIDSADGLVRASEDAFTAVVGASVSVARDLYEHCGGFAAFERRGIVDTEFGYRVWAAGAVLVPEPSARSFHQGERNFASRGDELKRQRAGLAANYLPIEMFRPSNKGRMWAVPMIRAIVPAESAAPETVQVTVDSVLASSISDLAVIIHGSETWGGFERAHEVTDYYMHDPRVGYLSSAPRSGFPSYYTFVVPAGVVVGRGTVAVMLERLRQDRVGSVRALGPSPGLNVELWQTRALERATRHAGRFGGIDKAGRELFGEIWLSGHEAGIRLVAPQRNRQGMLYDESVLA